MRVWLLNEPQVKPGVSEKQHAKYKDTHAAVLYLNGRWPLAFAAETRDVRPLALGVANAVLANAALDPGAPPREHLAAALAVWTATNAYLHALSCGRNRVNLDGSFSREVDAEHKAQALETLAKRKAKGVARAALRAAERLKAEEAANR
jgi:sRNA-binding protein